MIAVFRQNRKTAILFSTDLYCIRTHRASSVTRHKTFMLVTLAITRKRGFSWTKRKFAALVHVTGISCLSHKSLCPRCFLTHFHPSKRTSEKSSQYRSISWWPGLRRRCDHWAARIAASNPAESMDLCLLCLSCVLQLAISATGRSLVQRSPTDCGAS